MKAKYINPEAIIIEIAVSMMLAASNMTVTEKTVTSESMDSESNDAKGNDWDYE